MSEQLSRRSRDDLCLRSQSPFPGFTRCGKPESMKKKSQKTKSSAPIAPASGELDEVVRFIEAARTRAMTAVNTTLIELYWTIGEYISRKLASDGWGEGTVELLALHVRERVPNATGFSTSNLWRMRQFFDTYRATPVLAPLVRELSRTHNLLVMSRCKRDEEREF